MDLMMQRARVVSRKANVEGEKSEAGLELFGEPIKVNENTDKKVYYGYSEVVGYEDLYALWNPLHVKRDNAKNYYIHLELDPDSENSYGVSEVYLYEPSKSKVMNNFILNNNHGKRKVGIVLPANQDTKNTIVHIYPLDKDVSTEKELKKFLLDDQPTEYTLLHFK